MSEGGTRYGVQAPGASGSGGGAYAPGAQSKLPAVDDRLVAPESRAEILDGIVYRTMGSNQPHGMQHFDAAHLFAGVLADGYAGAVDMLTRADENSDAAPDISVFPAAKDPKTGGRQLEEIAIEVLDTERLSHTTAKVEKFAARGVRRLFAIRVKNRKVYEWSKEHGDWEELEEGSAVTDRCFRVPVPITAFVDRVLADDTVARALLAANNRVLQAAIEQGTREGELAGARAMLLTALGARAPLTEAQRARVAACEDTAVLLQWLTRSVAGESNAVILGG